MNFTHREKRKFILIIVVTVFAIAVFAITLIRATYYVPNNELKSVRVSASTTDPILYPQTLQIPSINVEAKVQEVGITTDGDMAAPHSLTDVGWYKYGTIPGNIGSAVIDGHVDNGLSLPAVFYNLKKLTKGDDIYITRKDSSTVHFKVASVDIYHYKEVPMEMIVHQNDKARLRLITCTGDWVPQDKTAEYRVVVTAELVS